MRTTINVISFIFLVLMVISVIPIIGLPLGEITFFQFISPFLCWGGFKFFVSFGDYVKKLGR